MYKSVYSKEVKLTILDPCRNSTVNEDLGLNITDMAVPDGKDKLRNIYLGPKNSVSVIYGNGYDRCGPLKYSLLSLDGKKLNLNVFSLDVAPNFDFSDSITLNLESFANGRQIVQKVIIKIELEQFPTSTPALF